MKEYDNLHLKLKLPLLKLIIFMSDETIWDWLLKIIGGGNSLSDKSIDVNVIKNLYNTLNAKNNTSNDQLEVYDYKLFELNSARNSKNNKNNKNNKIILLNLLPLQHCDIYAPFLYVVDEFNQLNNIENRKWYKLRKNKNDIVLSLNENKILNLKEILEKYA